MDVPNDLGFSQFEMYWHWQPSLAITEILRALNSHDAMLFLPGKIEAILDFVPAIMTTRVEQNSGS